MLQRRHLLRTGLAAASALGGLGLMPVRARAQGAAPTHVRYHEVVRSLFFAPAYVAMSRGYFREAGLDVELSTAHGGDQAAAALLGGRADIALLGPEAPIAAADVDPADRLRIFCGLTAGDGYLLCAREKPASFDWAALRGQEVMGWRPRSTPLVFLQAAMRLHGLDPQRDVRWVNGIAPPARRAAWLEGTTPYAIFSEPEASQLELDGQGHVVASIGDTVGLVDYTVFAATDRFLQAQPATVQAWTDAIARAMLWTEHASTGQLADALAAFFPAATPQALATGIERYRALRLWKTTPAIAPSAVERFQDLLVQGQVLSPDRRVAYDRLVDAQFAQRVG